MSKYAKKIVIRVFRENSWSENRVFMATITPRKKRHAIISQEINTETNKMKDWSRKRKTDFIIGLIKKYPQVQYNRSSFANIPPFPMGTALYNIWIFI